MSNTIIEITVIPKSSRSQINIDEHNNLRVYLNSPPADGKANAELIKLLSNELEISKFRIQIIKGAKGRKKRISLEGLTKEEVFELLRVRPKTLLK